MTAGKNTTDETSIIRDSSLDVSTIKKSDSTTIVHDTTPQNLDDLLVEIQSGCQIM